MGGRREVHGCTFAEAEAMPASLRYEELVQRNVVGPGQSGGSWAGRGRALHPVGGSGPPPGALCHRLEAGCLRHHLEAVIQPWLDEK